MVENKWARYMKTATDGANDSTIAAALAVSPSTVGRWRSGASQPQPQQVVAFAREFQRSPINALVAAGYISASETETAEVEPGSADDLSDVSTMRLLEELTHRVEQMGHLAQWVIAAGKNESHRGYLGGENIQAMVPDEAPANVDVDDILRFFGDRVKTSDLLSLPLYGIESLPSAGPADAESLVAASARAGLSAHRKAKKSITKETSDA